VGTAAPDFSISNLVAYEVGTTAAFGGPVTLGFKVPGPISEEEFNRLAVLHGVNGALVDITAAAPPRDYSTLTVYATTNTLGSFYLAKRATQKVQALFDQTKAFKAGSTVPVKVRLVDASSGANVSSSSTPLAARGLRLVGAATSLSVQDAGQANPDGGFRFAEGTDGGSYVFNLSTKGLAPGRYTLSVYAGGDRSFFHTVYFEVK
jgi:hypothetical protein